MPIACLGIPIDAKRQSKGQWRPAKEKIGKMGGWKGNIYVYWR